MSNKYCLCYVTKTGNREQGTGNELGEWENEKWEQNRIGNEVTDRPRVQIRFFPIFHSSGFSLRIQEAGERCNITGESFERDFTSE